MTAESGQLNSPEVFYNGTSPIITTCNWTIVAENKAIELQVLHLNLRLADYYCSSISNVLEVIYRFNHFNPFMPNGLSTVINWTSPFPILGLLGGTFNFNSILF